MMAVASDPTPTRPFRRCAWSVHPERLAVGELDADPAARGILAPVVSCHRYVSPGQVTRSVASIACGASGGFAMDALRVGAAIGAPAAGSRPRGHTSSAAAIRYGAFPAVTTIVDAAIG